MDEHHTHGEREESPETIITPQHESLWEPVAQAVSDTLPFHGPEPGDENDAGGDEINLIPGDTPSDGVRDSLTDSNRKL